MCCSLRSAQWTEVIIQTYVRHRFTRPVIEGASDKTHWVGQMEGSRTKEVCHHFYFKTSFV